MTTNNTNQSSTSVDLSDDDRVDLRWLCGLSAKGGLLMSKARATELQAKGWVTITKFDVHARWAHVTEAGREAYENYVQQQAAKAQGDSGS